MNKKIILGIAIVIVLVIVYIALVFNSRISPQTQTGISTASWKTCNYPSFGFLVKYPSDWKIYVYSAHQGAGDTPIQTTCGDIDANQLNPQVTMAPSPDWNSSTTGGMQIVLVPSAVIQYQERVNPVIGTSTIGGKVASILQDGSVIVNGYKLSFGKTVSGDIKSSILSSFQFISK